MTAADSGAPATGTIGSSLGGDVPGPCSDGVVRDDGSAEGAWGWVPSVVDGRYVQEFELAEFPTHNIETFCVCWRRTREDTDLDFEVVFFQHDRVVDEDDGSIDWVPQMDPYAVVPASASGITDQVEGTWVEVDVGSVEPPLGQFFSVGVRWNPSVDQFFFICGDKSPETPRSNVWFIDDRAEGWTSVLNTIDPIFVDHRAFLMRAVEGPVLPSVVDVPSLSRWGLGALAMALLLVALTVHRRR